MEKYTDEQLKALGTSEWVKVLKESPELVGKCDKWDEFDEKDWNGILPEQPQFDKCSKANVRDSFGPYAWRDSQSWYPKIVGWFDKVNVWEKFGSNAWCYFLSKQLGFAGKCDKLNGWKNFSVENWLCLLSKQPQFADRCDKECAWWNFYSYDWRKLLTKQPQFADRCDVWKEFDEEGWSELLSVQPQLTDEAKKYVLGWEAILKRNPKFVRESANSKLAGEFAKWGYWNGEDLCGYLSSWPQSQLVGLCDKVNVWKNFDSYNWSELLSAQPQFADRCDKVNGWEEFYSWNWSELLSVQPQFANRCDKSKRMKND